MILIANKKDTLKALGFRQDVDIAVDVISPMMSNQYRHLSPMTPQVPRFAVPGWPGLTSKTVEGVWQGLKIKQGQIDLSKLENEAPSAFRRGRPEGHALEPPPGHILSLGEARRKYYIPLYEQQLARHESIILLLHVELCRALQRKGRLFLVSETPEDAKRGGFHYTSLLVQRLEFMHAHWRARAMCELAAQDAKRAKHDQEAERVKEGLAKEEADLIVQTNRREALMF